MQPTVHIPCCMSLPVPATIDQLFCCVIAHKEIPCVLHLCSQLWRRLMFGVWRHREIHNKHPLAHSYLNMCSDCFACVYSAVVDVALCDGVYIARGFGGCQSGNL